MAASLFWVWLWHDIEELQTYRWSSRAVEQRLPRWVPRPPAPSQQHVNLAITIMGTVVASASVAGIRTGGRSRFFQNSVWAFGAHGVGHLLASTITRGYTTGAITSATLVLPYWAWACRRLRRTGVLMPARPAAAMLQLGLALAMSHALAAAVDAVTRSPSTRRSTR